MTEGLGPAPENDEAREARAPHWIAPIVTWLCSEEAAGVTGRVFEASGQTLAVAEGWVRGPSTAPLDDPTQLGPVVADLLAKARPNSGMDGSPGSLAPDHPHQMTPFSNLRTESSREHHTRHSPHGGHRMPLNPDAVGSKSEPSETSWNSKDALLYAVGIGAGADELAFTTENTKDVEQLVFPTFPVACSGAAADRRWARSARSTGAARARSAVRHAASADPGVGDGDRDGRDHGDLRQGHGSRRRQPGGRRDGRRAALHHHLSAFIRGEGGWGGDRGPSGREERATERDPDHEVTYQTSPDQAFVYRLSGDRNPLHTDPSFAAIGRLPAPDPARPVQLRLHRSCVAALVVRQRPGEVPPHRGSLRRPGDAGRCAHVRMWSLGDGESVFTTSAVDPSDPSTARVVIDQGLLKHS